MRAKWFLFLLMQALLLSPVSGWSQGSREIMMKMKGSQTGTFIGQSTPGNHDNAVPVLRLESASVQIESSVMEARNARHAANHTSLKDNEVNVTVVLDQKLLDQLMHARQTNESISEVAFLFFKSRGGNTPGTPEKTLLLKDAYIKSVELQQLNGKDNEPATINFTLVYKDAKTIDNAGGGSTNGWHVNN